MQRITTEREWRTCSDPNVLLLFGRGQLDTHRFRWLAVDWGQRIRHLFRPDDLPWYDAFAAWVAGTGKHPRRVCIVSAFQPLYHAPPADITSADRCADAIRRNDSMVAAVTAGVSASDYFPQTDPPVDYSNAHRSQANRVSEREHEPSESHRMAWLDAKVAHSFRIRQQLCDEFRDIAGNPFRPVTLQTGWQTSVVMGLAQGIDDTCGFDQLPILADALEEAGCDNAEVLQHCRGFGPHVRGCWVIDLLLGRL